MTVSRALHSPQVVAKKTRASVQKAVDELGYIPDLAAGSLSSKKSSLIAVMLPSLHFTGHTRTVDGLSTELRKNGFHLLIGDHFYSKEEEKELLNVILGRRPAGIVIINSIYTNTGRKTLSNSGIPVIETWDLPGDPLDCVVGFSHFDVGVAQTEELIRQGYRKIAYIGGHVKSDPQAYERRRGYLSAMRAHQLSDSEHITVRPKMTDIECGKQGIIELLKKHPGIEAVICMTDPAAMGAMMEARRLGISVPQDLAIAGHGDFDFSEHLVPALSTVKIDAFKIGKIAARLLMKKIEGQDIPATQQMVDVGFKIISRESTHRTER